FFFQAEDGIRDRNVTGVQTCALPIYRPLAPAHGLGAWIELLAAWDNSAGNARNPNRPPQPVRWGERTVDEMGHAAILYTLDDERSEERRVGKEGRSRERAGRVKHVAV